MELFTEEYKNRLETVLKCQSDLLENIQKVIYGFSDRIDSLEKD